MSGWVHVSLGIVVVVGKSSKNCHKPVLIFWSSIPCVFCLYTLLKVVSYYDLSALSMSVMCFQKKFGWGWVGGVSSNPLSSFIFDCLNFLNFANPPVLVMNHVHKKECTIQCYVALQEGGPVSNVQCYIKCLSVICIMYKYFFLFNVNVTG